MDTSTLSPDPRIVISGYIDSRRNSLRPRTLEMNLRDLLALHQRLYDRRIYLFRATVGDIMRDVCEAQLSGIKPSTISRRLSVFGGFFEYAVENELIPENPVAVVPRPKRIRHADPSRLLTQAEWETVLNATDPSMAIGKRNHLLLRFLAMTDIETSSLLNLTLQDIDLETGIIRTMRRGGNSIQLPLEADLLKETSEFITHHRSGISFGETIYLFPSRSDKPLRRGAVRYILNNCVNEAGVPKKVRTHDLRRSYLRNTQ